MVAMMSLPAAHAAIVDVNSGLDLGSEGNNITGNDVIITDPDPAWAPSGTTADGAPYVWVSYADTGFAACLPGTHDAAPCPQNAIGNVPSAVFTKVFDLPMGTNTGFISIWADDSAGVTLNGQVLVPVNTTLGKHCSSGVIGCQTGHDYTIQIGGPDGIFLGAGSQTLTLDVYQLGGGPFGVMYGGQIDSVPEPSSYMLYGLGLIVLMIAAPRLRKRV